MRPRNVQGVPFPPVEPENEHKHDETGKCATRTLMVREEQPRAAVEKKARIY